MAIGSHHSAKAGKDEWLTPPEILKVLGLFDLDPCSPIGRPWDTAREHYTIEDNGLKKPWRGRVWCNPPYGSATGIWLGRLADHGDGIALIFGQDGNGHVFQSGMGKGIGGAFFERADPFLPRQRAAGCGELRWTLRTGGIRIPKRRSTGTLSDPRQAGETVICIATECVMEIMEIKPHMKQTHCFTRWHVAEGMAAKEGNPSPSIFLHEASQVLKRARKVGAIRFMAGKKRSCYYVFV